MSTSFFTMLKAYFQCCTNRCSCCFNNQNKEENEPSRDNITYNPSGDNSPFSFDDLSNPSTPGTPITWSSSSSSLDSYKNQPYKRPQFKPYIGIIPANYYSD